MKSAFFLLGVLALPQVAHAHGRQMPNHDLSTLSFLSDAVIEGVIVAPRRDNYELSADVRVEKTWLGQNLTGKTLTVGDLSLYYKDKSRVHNVRLEMRMVRGDMEDVYTPSPTQQQQMTHLGSEDRVIFFVRNSSTPLKRPPRLQNTGLVPVESGVYLVRQNQVSGFTHMGQAYPYRETFGRTRVRFDSELATTLSLVADLKAHLQAPPQRKDVAYFQHWKALRQKAVGHQRVDRDLITYFVDERLKQIAQLNTPTAQTP